MKTFTLLLILLTTWLFVEEAGAQCGSTLQMIELGENEADCFGYAMARAVGLDNPTCFNAQHIYSEYFSHVTWPAGVHAGDIIVFARPETPLGDIDVITGHATYVRQVLYGNKPDGPIGIGPTGNWRDQDIPDPYGYDDIICDQVPSGGGLEQLGKTLTWVLQSVAPSGYVAKAVYKLKAAYKCSTTFRNDFNGGRIGVGKTAQGTYFDFGSPYNEALARKSVVEAKAFTMGQDLSGNWHTFAGVWQEGTNYWGTQEITVVILSADKVYRAMYTPSSPPGAQVSFENVADGISFGSIIKVNGEDALSPTRDYSLGAAAEAYSVLDGIGVRYTFQNWIGGPTSTTYVPTSAGRYYANYSAKPFPPEHLSVTWSVGSHPVLHWDENPNTYVTNYKIWRQPKYQSWSQVATVNQGTTHWTDLEYTVTGTGTDFLVWYYVLSYYSPNQSVSDPGTVVSVQATESGASEPVNKDVVASGIASGLKTESATVSAYPNPFNPSTVIAYTLLEDSHVQLEVFDLMGRRVVELINGFIPAGAHSIEWHGTNQRGNDISSGTYLYRFTVSSVGELGKATVRYGRIAKMK